MRSQFHELPDWVFADIVKQYAFEMGRPVHTLADERAAFLNYIYFATLSN